MATDNLQQMSSLDTPRVHVVRIERSSKHNFSIIIDFKTNKLAPNIRLESSELLLLHGIISENSTIKTARKQGLAVGEAESSDGCLVLGESCDAEAAVAVP